MCCGDLGLGVQGRVSFQWSNGPDRRNGAWGGVLRRPGMPQLRGLEAPPPTGLGAGGLSPRRGLGRLL